MAGIQIKLYKDETVTGANLDRLNEIHSLFKEEACVKFVSRQECLNMKSTSEGVIFVFGVFEGTAFDYLRQLNARIISAACILNSIKAGIKLPKSVIPVFSHSMLNLNVCCTNMEKKARETIYDMVEMMRGKVTKIFTEKVTHLITTEVGSAKYHAACQMKIPVMLPEWVHEVWKESEIEAVSASDARFLKYKCPVFHRYVICASGFKDSTKTEIKKLVEVNGGGKYDGNLACAVTTHLVLNEPKGDKFIHARAWKITMVKSSWIYRSIEAGYCLPEKDFLLEMPEANTSTPTDSRRNASKKTGNITALGDISVIPGALNNSTKLVNETDNNRTMSATMLNGSCLISGNTVTPVATSCSNATRSNADFLKALNAIGKIDIGLFDGIGIFCENFDALINDKLRKMTNAGGAIRFDEYNSDVTHVIANLVNEKQCKSYIELNPEVNILSIDWLINSCKSNQLEDCKSYCVFKNALNSVKTPKKRTRPEITLEVNRASNLSSEINDCLSQYAGGTANSGTSRVPTAQASHIPFTSNFNAKIQQYESNVESSTKETNNASAANLSSNANKSKQQTSTSNSSGSDTTLTGVETTGVFVGRKFQIIGFSEAESAELSSLLKQKGARFVTYSESELANYSSSIVQRKRQKEPCDFTVFPLTLPAPTNAINPVTPFWIRRCISNQVILPLEDNIFNQPLPRFYTDKPLADCVITVSGFNQPERDTVTTLCQVLGAHCQQSFSLKHAQSILPNTHLVCKLATGPKYAAAVTWNIPVVCVEWLIDTCVSGTKADERKYSFENTPFYQKELYDAVTKIRQSEDADEMSSANNNSLHQRSSHNVTNNRSANNNNNTTAVMCEDDVDQNNPKYQVEEMDNEEVNNHNDSSLSTSHTIAKKPRLDTSHGNDHSNKNSSSTTVNNDSDLILAAIENSYKMKNKHIEQLPTASATATTTATPSLVPTPCNPRLAELKKNNHTPNRLSHQPLSNQSPATTHSPAAAVTAEKFSTPVWLKPKDPNNPQADQVMLNFNYELAMEHLKTPTGVVRNANRTGAETPLDELFMKGIQIANDRNKKGLLHFDPDDSPQFDYSFAKRKKQQRAQLAAEDGCMGENMKDSNDDDIRQEADENRIQPTPAYLKHTRQVLRGVNVYVSKKLMKDQKELAALVEYMGGEYSWTYNDACTHFVYAGSGAAVNKELNLAREESKIIVTPAWLWACRDEDAHVDEAAFSLEHGTTEDEHSSSHKENEAEETTTTMTAEVDLKRAMLDQLQDQLVKIGKSNKNISISHSKKFSRNKSDINNRSSDLAAEEAESKGGSNFPPDSDETAMLRQLEFNEKLNADDENTGRRRNGKMPASISTDRMASADNKKILDEASAGTIMPSQIQVTLWKDSIDVKSVRQQTNSTTVNGGRGNQRLQSNGSGSTKMSDAIADRIVHATRVANNSKK